MTRFSNKADWLFRRRDGDGAAAGQTSALAANDAEESLLPVLHKLLVHLPDLETRSWAVQAASFLCNTNRDCFPTLVKVALIPNLEAKVHFEKNGRAKMDHPTNNKRLRSQNHCPCGRADSTTLSVGVRRSFRCWFLSRDPFRKLLEVLLLKTAIPLLHNPHNRL